MIDNKQALTANIKGKLMDFSSPKVMGILNITPDSFYAQSRNQTEREIAERAVRIANEGADIVDIGGYSSRPGAAYVSEQEEMERIAFGLKILFREVPEAVVSVDTFRSQVAKIAVEEYGASIINDISGGELDEAMFDTAAELQVPYILMHMRGTPQSMMQDLQYDCLQKEVFLYFARKINQLHQRGVNDIWLDPGFGFSKTTAQNYELLAKLEDFRIFDLPLLVGLSRKTLIREVLDTTSEGSLNGTTALNMLSLTKGANILRVHDVREAVETIKLFNITQNKR